MLAAPHPSASKLSRLRAQTKVIRWLNGLLLCAFGLSVGGLVVASALPQKRQLEDKRAELARVEEARRRVQAEKEDAKAAQEALLSDPEYLELHARDRLNLRGPGEKVYRIERDR
jgi:cell division protein FtsB